MALFGRSKEKRQAEEENRMTEMAESRSLSKLSQGDLSRVKEILYNIDDPYGRIRGNEAEVKQLEYLDAIVEQNFLIIKLLNELKNK